MLRNQFLLLSLASLLLLYSCKKRTNNSTRDHAIQLLTQTQNPPVNLLTDVEPIIDSNSTIQAIIEIPAGSIEKWELHKSTGVIVRDSVNNLPRTINYLGYPANYGMIPGTLLSKEKGGDGDPLDVIVLGPTFTKGAIVKCKIIGVLYLKDRGEQDDKLIAIAEQSLFDSVENIVDLKHNYEGILEIIELWFTNYKGPQKMESFGFGSKSSAIELLNAALVQ